MSRINAGGEYYYLCHSGWHCTSGAREIIYSLILLVVAVVLVFVCGRFMR